jgi:hypothetical protein
MRLETKSLVIDRKGNVFGADQGRENDNSERGLDVIVYGALVSSM